MLATTTVRIKAIAPRLSGALRKTRDRLIPGKLLLRELIAAETRFRSLPQTAMNDSNRLHAFVTTSRRDILAAQRLRYRVFTEEYGAQFDGIAGIDSDRFDRHCRHLVVKDTATGLVVACTRILTADRARRAGGWYSAGEFDLGMVESLEGGVLEIGRTCVHPDYRNGAAIGVLWSGLAEILRTEGFTWMFGCASIPLSDPAAARMLDAMQRRSVSDERHLVLPRLPVPALPASADASGKLPPLLRTYLSMGAQVCGEACWDPDFNCADVFILVNRHDIPARYINHFMGRKPELAA